MSIKNCALSIAIVIMLGCDYITRFQKETVFDGPVPLDCIENAIAATQDVDRYNLIRSPQQMTYDEFLVYGTDSAHVSVNRLRSDNATVTVNFGWMGKTQKDAATPSLRLAYEIHNSLIETCGNGVDVLQIAVRCTPNIECSNFE